MQLLEFELDTHWRVIFQCLCSFLMSLSFLYLFRLYLKHFYIKHYFLKIHHKFSRNLYVHLHVCIFYLDIEWIIRNTTNVYCLHWNYILKCNAVWLLWYVNLKVKVQLKEWWKKNQPYSDALVTYYRNVGSWNWPKELHKWSKPFCFINLNMYLYKFYYYKWERIWNHLCLFHVLRNKNQTSKQTKISIKIHNFKCFIINYKLFILTMWYSYNVEDFFCLLQSSLLPLSKDVFNSSELR